jgi:hypothetical protein
MLGMLGSRKLFMAKLVLMQSIGSRVEACRGLQFLIDAT